MDDGSSPVVRVIRDYDATEPDEITLRVGDLLYVDRRIDRFWLSGSSWDGSRGKFPSASVYPMEIPSNGHHLFAATCNFPGQEPGDLPLSRGDVIVGIREVDANWWEGSCKGVQGIFPLSHVWKFPQSSPIASVAATMQTATNGDSHNVVDAPIYDNLPPPQLQPITTTTTAAPSPKPQLAQALYNFPGEQPSDLPFHRGDMLKILREIDGNWMEGELDGRVGIFPASFVERLPSLHTPTLDDPSTLMPPDTWGKALFDFQPQQDRDLRLVRGDVVRLLRKINSDWYEAMNPATNEFGICPAPFIRVVDDPAPRRESSSNPPDPTDDLPPSYEDAVFQGAQTKDASARPKEVEILQGQLKTVEQRQSKLREELGHRPAPHVVEEINKQMAIYQDQIDGIRKELRFLANDLSKQMFGPPSSPSPSKPPRPLSTSLLDTGPPVAVTQPSPSASLLDTGPPSTSLSDAGPPSTSLMDTAPPSTSTSPPEDQQDRRRRKQEEQRQCVVLEMIQTEKDYIQDLRICLDILTTAGPGGQAVGVDIPALTGNLDEVIEVADRLLRRLNKASSAGTNAAQLIGEAFVDLADDIKQTYGHYFRNYDEITALMDKYEAEPRSRDFIAKLVDSIRNQTNCFNLSAMLIKPVQRLAKYPLLLKELERSAAETGGDQGSLQHAEAVMDRLIRDINDFKLRQDLLFKYRDAGTANESFTAKIAKINLHSVKKKSARMGMKLGSTLGLTSVTKDEVFDRHAEEFQSLEKTLKSFNKNVEGLMGRLEDLHKSCLALAERVISFGKDSGTPHSQLADNMRTLHHTVLSQFWADFKTSVEANVTGILTRLLQAFLAPKFLIDKCNDKKLDFDSATHRLEKNKDVTKKVLFVEEQTAARRNYEALRHQLVEELPRLTELGTTVLTDCVEAFLVARKTLLGRAAKLTLDLLQPLLQNPSSLSADQQEVIERLSKLSLVPRNLFPASVSRPVSMTSQPPQSESQKMYVRSQYPPDKLYVVREKTRGMEGGDLGLNAGELVGVMVQQGPRWVVDNGARKGTILASYLAPLPPPTFPLPTSAAQRPVSPGPPVYDNLAAPPPVYNPSPPQYSTPSVQYSNIPSSPPRYSMASSPTYHNIPSTPPQHPSPVPPIYSSTPSSPLYNNLSVDDPLGHRYEEIPDSPSPAQQQLPAAQPPQFFYAKYAFSSKGPGQLGLKEGQVVRLLQNRDFNGNAEWWLVQDRYQHQGFVPADYLQLYHPS